MKHTQGHSFTFWGTCLLSFFLLVQLFSCQREPELHLHYGGHTGVEFPMVNLNLDVFWDYDPSVDWKEEWCYGWDAQDQLIFGNIGYTEPNDFNVIRYFLGDKSSVRHTMKEEFEFSGKRLFAKFDFGYYDLLVRNQIEGRWGVQSTRIDDSSLDSVTAYTGNSMQPANYHLPMYDKAFYQPEEVFAAYEQNFFISRDPKDYDYFDAETNAYVKNAHVTLLPVTYIYLTQVRLFHNNGRVYNVDGNANLSGMARGVTLNNGQSFKDQITVNYNVRFKKDCLTQQGDTADIIGGRCLTFGIPGENPSMIKGQSRIYDHARHYMDVNVVFYNGMDSTIVFDVTEQVRRRYRGGVITVNLDMDTIPVPTRPGGSGFDATVKDFDEEEHVIEI